MAGVLEKALMISFVNSRIQMINLEVALHEMKVANNPELGKLQHRVEKLISANRNLYSTLERNLTQEITDAIEMDTQQYLEKSWD